MFLKKCSSLLENGEALRSAWSKAIELDKNIAGSDAQGLLSSMGNQLGATDVEGQLSCIGYCRRELEKKLVSQEEKSKKYSGVFPALGLLTGVWVIILFV